MSKIKYKVKRLRAEGMSLREIAAHLGTSVGSVTHHLYYRKRASETDRSVIHHVTTLGMHGSWSCVRVPVSLPRVSIQEVSNAAA